MDAALHSPTKKEQQEAKLAHDTLEGASKYISKEEGNHRVELLVDESVKVTVPESALDFLLKFLPSLGEGQAVSILALGIEMSTQQAADILNVSRPHLVKLLEDDEIPYHKVGSHRRIKAKDLMEYKVKWDEEREGMLNELTSQAQELDMGYLKMIHKGNFTVVLDACVLYPAPVRDILLRLAQENLYRPKWSKEINDEWKRNLLENREDLEEEKIDRTIDVMNKAFADANVDRFKNLICSVELPDPDDRHVVAAEL